MRLIALSVSALLLAGCTTNPKKMDQYQLADLAHATGVIGLTKEKREQVFQEIQAREGFSDSDMADIRAGRVSVGDAMMKVYYAWGSPMNRRNYTSEYGTTVWWDYGLYSEKSVSFENGRVDFISNHPRPRVSPFLR